MAKVLHFTLEPERLHPGFATLIGCMNPGAKQEYQLTQANRLYLSGTAITERALQKLCAPMRDTLRTLR